MDHAIIGLLEVSSLFQWPLRELVLPRLVNPVHPTGSQLRRETGSALTRTVFPQAAIVESLTFTTLRAPNSATEEQAGL